MWPTGPGTGFAFIRNRIVMQLQLCERQKEEYPIKWSFDNEEDLEFYLSGDFIECLLCGKRFKRLDNHIRAVHRITLNDYKKQYNIPLEYKLECEELTEKEKKRLGR